MPEKITLTILLSGPEPQRTIFENILLSQITQVKGTIAFVRGLPDAETIPAFQQQGLVFYNHLPAGQLEDLLNESQLIVCRAGYSTIMDLVALEKKAILVPTPGQTEQEYLATSLFKKGIFYSVQQENFSLIQAMEATRSFEFRKPGSYRINHSLILQQVKEIIGKNQAPN